MAYALSMESSHNPIFTNKETGKNSGDVMLIVTIIYSIFTLLGISSFLNPIMNKLEVTQADTVARLKEQEESKTEIERELMNSIEKKRNENCCVRLKKRVGKFDMYYFSPLFIKDNEAIKLKNEKVITALNTSIKNAKRERRYKRSQEFAHE